MASVEVPHGETVRGGQIFDHHFGVNFIANKDEADGGGALPEYQDAVNDLASGGPISVRFPGGGVAETGDFTVLDDGVVEPGTHTWEFLEDAARNGWSVSIVLPTWRFLDLETMTMDTATATAEVEAYARSLFAAAETLGVTIDGFEIGNEFDLMAEKTNGSATLTGDETEAFSDAYVEVAAAMTVALEDEIGAAGLDGADAPWIGVQALWSWIPENWRKARDFRAALEDAFTDAGALDAVDALITHVYPWLELEQNPQDWLAGDTHIIDTLAATAAVFGRELDWVVSEWEVSFGAGDAIETLKDHYDGIKQLEPVVSLFSQMVVAGIDHMNLWPVRNGAFTALETLGGEEKPLSYLFDMMSDQLPGLAARDLNGDAAGTMWETGDDIHVYAFESDDRAVLYFGSRSDQAQSLDVDLSAWRGDGDKPLIEVTWIHVDDPDAKGYQQGTEIETRAYTWNAFHQDAAEILTFSPYEMIVVEVVYEAADGKAETGTERHDFLFGTTGEDTLVGGAGDDWLYGRLGADFIDAGDGNDVIYGGRQGDRIIAGAGDDVVDGGNGRDRVDLGDGADLFRDNDQGRFSGEDVVDGGAGDDTFLIGGGDDRLTGGSGADTFDFGTVSDRTDEDTITDFTLGEDLLRIDGKDYATIEALVADFEVFSDGVDTVVHLGELGWVTLQGIDASGIDGVAPPPEMSVVTGTSGADRLLGGTPFCAKVFTGAGNDEIYGGAGTDEIFAGLGDDRLFGGTGDDSLDGGDGADKLYGGRQRDRLYGGDGDDLLWGEAEADELFGEDGDDRIFGGGGDDLIDGGAGDDLLTDGHGEDQLWGGAGADVFRLRFDGQDDRIFDFEPGVDVIDLSCWRIGGLDALSISAREPGWVAIETAGDRLLVQFDAAQSFVFTDADFLF